MNGKVCSIICGAPGGLGGEEAALIRSSGGMVIAADKGLDHALRAGIKPDLVVGDFDSADMAVPDGVECLRVSPIKDDTDAQLAAETAIERGYGELRFFCALGGRLDHTLANIQMMYGLLERGVRACLYGCGERVYFVRGKAEAERYEGYLSVFAFGGEVCVSLSGVKYPLERGKLTNAFPLGVSNEITAQRAVIEVHSGTALVVEQRKEEVNS